MGTARKRAVYRVLGPGSAMIGALLLPLAVSAQVPPAPKSPGPPEVVEPPSESPAPPSDPSTGGAQPKEPLTKELHEGEGVLEPPRGIDPEIEKPPPENFEGRTPVIPPPGEPGSQQDMQPK